MRPFIIAVDFDGTCVDHRYPDVGADVPGAVSWLKSFVHSGAKIILWTMRCGRELDEARQWFEAHGIPLHGVNANPDQKSWTTSPKAYAHMYIDDMACGCPLRENPRCGGRPFVDWDVVGEIVREAMGQKQETIIGEVTQ